MCDEIGVFTDKEVKALDPKRLKALRAEARRQFKSPGIQRLINQDPIGKVIHPHGDIQKRLRKKLTPTFNRLVKAAQKEKA